MLHLVKKMRPVKDGGARFIIVQNGSPLFTGGASSGESEIRRYLLENEQVLESEPVRKDLKDVLLGPEQLYEALRDRGAQTSA